MSFIAGMVAGALSLGGMFMAWKRNRGFSSEPTIGYWKIRGLAAALRMMCYYKGQSFKNVGYGEDAKEKWFGGAKPAMLEKNALMNLPYVVDGETVVTQSNSCLLYLGKKLGIDTEANSMHNHQALDQLMDLRNGLMDVVYPFAGKVKTKEELAAMFPKHMETAVKGHLAKLEDFCVGPYLCGNSPESADFHLFEMLDQHMTMCCELSVAEFDFKQFPKLMTLFKSFRAEPKLAAYFASDCYSKYAFNNPGFTHFLGPGYTGPFGNTVEEVIGA